MAIKERLRVQLDFRDPDGKIEAYLTSCAKIRDIAPRSLIRRLLVAIVEDQLVGSILDDADHLRARGKGEHRFRGDRGLSAE